MAVERKVPNCLITSELLQRLAFIVALAIDEVVAVSLETRT